MMRLKIIALASLLIAMPVTAEPEPPEIPPVPKIVQNIINELNETITNDLVYCFEEVRPDSKVDNIQALTEFVQEYVDRGDQKPVSKIFGFKPDTFGDGIEYFAKITVVKEGVVIDCSKY